MDNFVIGVFLIFLVAMVVSLILVHRDTSRLKRLMDRERFIPIDNSGVVFEPEPEPAEMEQYDYVRGLPIDQPHRRTIKVEGTNGYIYEFDVDDPRRPRGHFATQHQVDGDLE